MAEGIVYNQKPTCEFTTPIEGVPDRHSEAYIKIYDPSTGDKATADKYPICKLIYEEFWDGQYQYIFEPIWDNIDNMPERWLRLNCRHIPEIGLDLRYARYYRANILPGFMYQRTPPRQRDDVMDMMKSAGLNYYDRFDYLVNTDRVYDYLILEATL